MKVTDAGGTMAAAARHVRGRSRATAAMASVLRGLSLVEKTICLSKK